MGLRKRFGALEILKGIDLTLEKGGFLVLVGPSGCGKSTLAQHHRGPGDRSAPARSASTASTINDLHPSKRDIAMVFQSYALYPNMSVAQNMAFGMEMRGVPKPERDKAVGGGRQDAADRASADRAGRASFRAASASASRWAARWCASRACSCSTSRLSNLDAKLRVDMRVEIKRLHQRTGTTIVYVTHDQIEAMTLATRIAVLKDGELQQVGTPYEIYNSPANLFVADFMGSPSMNLLEGKVARANGARLDRARARRIIRRSCCRRPPSADAGKLADGAKVIFGIRPEAVSDIESADRNSKSIATFDAKVEIVEPAGSDTFVVTAIAGKEVTARMRADADVRVGQNHVLRVQSRQGRAVRSATTRRI